MNRLYIRDGQWQLEAEEQERMRDHQRRVIEHQRQLLDLGRVEYQNTEEEIIRLREMNDRHRLEREKLAQEDRNEVERIREHLVRGYYKVRVN